MGGIIFAAISLSLAYLRGRLEVKGHAHEMKRQQRLANDRASDILAQGAAHTSRRQPPMPESHESA